MISSAVDTIERYELIQQEMTKKITVKKAA